MSYDRSTVEAVIQQYFDAVHEGDADKLGAIFHPRADLRSLEKGELRVLKLPAWLAHTGPIKRKMATLGAASAS